MLNVLLSSVVRCERKWCVGLYRLIGIEVSQLPWLSDHYE